jgi:hypothetical protein
VSAVDLEPSEARYLSVLLARDICDDEEREVAETPTARRHRLIWVKLQPACQWDEADSITPP